jgi:hypothetical protein
VIFTVFATSQAIQFNLEPETDHEKKLLDMLKDFKGAVKIHQGVDIGVSRGEFIRQYGEPRVDTQMAITIQRDP